MASYLGNSDFSVTSGPFSSHESGSPPRVDVLPTVCGGDLFLSAIGGTITAPVATDTLEQVAVGEQDDIYRGERPPSPVPRVHDTDESSVASSSSSALNVGRRFGTLAGVVDAAISRWARVHASASDASSSSSSSSASSVARTQTTRRRKGRRYSISATSQNAAHERAFIARKKAFEELRFVPRGFSLLLPSDSAPGQTSSSPRSSEQAKERRTIQTNSLTLILSQLDSALKKSAKTRKAQEQLAMSGAPSGRGRNKGKGKNTIPRAASAVNNAPATLASFRSKNGNAPRKSWWLDVASPSWDDLRSIGQLLRLHPLTLEDILHRDPREKLEVFPALGYYFIVFRALGGERARERFHRFRVRDSEGAIDLPSSWADEGVIGAVNVYMVVFSEGICSFHFEDISEHTDKLRNKVLRLENTFDMTSDWIAHGLMDSIVDSFFPILTSIEREVKEVDSLVLSDPSRSDAAKSTKIEAVPIQSADEDSSASISAEKKSSDRLDLLMDEKNGYDKEGIAILPHTIGMPKLPFALFQHIKCLAQKLLWRHGCKKPAVKAESISSTTRTLLRIAAIRRIVTSLGRLLGTKGEVLAQIRKRLILASVEANRSGLGTDLPSDSEVAIYIGDIQDHIATLQQSLNHYERMLSHSHPTYLSQLGIFQSLAKGNKDKAILLLTVVSIMVLSMQLCLGLFSMNVGKLPSSEGNVEHPFLVFYSILGVCVVIGSSVVALFRYWHVQAKRKYSRKL